MKIIKTDFLEYDADFFKKNNLNPENFFFASNISNAFFFIKDTKTTMVLANKNILKAFGHYDIKPIMGLRNEDFVPTQLCHAYTKDDMSVINGKSIIDRTELAMNLDGESLTWRVTSKYPFYNSKKQIIGLISLSLPLDSKEQTSTILGKAISYLEENLSKKISVEELAKFTNLSVSSLERKFKSVYKVSPISYHNMMRVNKASLLILETNKSIAEISNELGFYDQSYMCKIFKKNLKMSPKEFKEFFSASNRVDKRR